MTTIDTPQIQQIPIGIDGRGTRRETDRWVRSRCLPTGTGGAQTQRSLIHFSIGGDRMHKRLYHVYGYVKKAAARVNARARDGLPAGKPN
jgi:fumarate hydratase, class II